MQTQQDQVRSFMQLAGQACPSLPAVPDEPTQALRCSLIHEELEELFHAMAQRDIVETADAIGDLLVVVLGTAVSCGIQISPVFDEIHRSNMTKFIDGHRREDGKWIKGPSYTPANLKPVLWDQMHSST